MDKHKVKWIEVYIEDDQQIGGYKIEHHDDVEWWIENNHLCISEFCKHITRYPDVAYDKFVTRGI